MENYAKGFWFDSDFNAFMYRAHNKTGYPNPRTLYEGHKSNATNFVFDAKNSDSFMMTENIWVQLHSLVLIVMSFEYFSYPG
jgi:hypothetical protein